LWRKALISGESFKDEDFLQIVRIDDLALFFEMEQHFYNGHACAIKGLATYSASGTFSFHDTNYVQDAATTSTPEETPP